ncbi:MAG: L,D-transpeptidase family protein [Anaerolineae bacterium]|nr:L,D-transpeptidase family protein [Anaerolineae bacterium]
MHRITALITISLFWLACIFCHPHRAAATAPQDTLQSLQQASVVHVVKRGENLFRIALNYGVSTQAIMAANGMRTTNVVIGQRIVIPGKSAVVVAKPAPPKPTPAPVNRTAPSPAPPNPISDSPKGQVYAPIILDRAEQPEPARIGNVPPVGKFVWVSISQQRMAMYENGNLVHENLVSTGRAGSDTAIGNFRIKTKLDRPYSRLWNLWMPYWLGIYDVGPYENGFHAPPSTPAGAVLWRESLGKPASFGCIVLSENDAARLYAWVEIGTPVSIRP